MLPDVEKIVKNYQKAQNFYLNQISDLDHFDNNYMMQCIQNFSEESPDKIKAI